MEGGHTYTIQSDEDYANALIDCGNIQHFSLSRLRWSWPRRC